jgi:phosphoribosylformylglycinamidine synthase
MASKGGVGIELDLDHVPTREEGMTPYEMMLSESQERMLMVLKPGREAEAEGVFRKWDLDFAVIGRVTQTGHLVLKFQGGTVADIPIPALADDAPQYDRPHEPTPSSPIIDPASLQHPKDAGAVLLKLLGSPNLSSRRWIWEQYDHMVMADTVARPGGDAAIVRVHGTKKALAMTSDCTPRYVGADPVEGGKQAVVEAWRNLTAVGAVPLAITDCMNFGNPERPRIMGQFVGAIEGMSQACRMLGFPVVSGNVSLYNETNGRGVLPTPQIGAIGLIPDVERRASAGFAREGDAILLFGATQGHMGRSRYLADILGRDEGTPPPVDLVAEKRIGDFLRAHIRSGLIDTVHDLSDGGLLVALAEMALSSGIGATLSIDPGRVPLNAFLFGEDQGRYIVALKDEEALRRPAEDMGIPVQRIGVTGGRRLLFPGHFDLDLAGLASAHEGWFPSFMAG